MCIRDHLHQLPWKIHWEHYKTLSLEGKGTPPTEFQFCIQAQTCLQISLHHEDFGTWKRPHISENSWGNKDQASPTSHQFSGGKRRTQQHPFSSAFFLFFFFFYSFHLFRPPSFSARLSDPLFIVRVHLACSCATWSASWGRQLRSIQPCLRAALTSLLPAPSSRHFLFNARSNCSPVYCNLNEAVDRENSAYIFSINKAATATKA